jgi:hypothetical protein
MFVRCAKAFSLALAGSAACKPEKCRGTKMQEKSKLRLLLSA